MYIVQITLRESWHCTKYINKGKCTLFKLHLGKVDIVQNTFKERKCTLYKVNLEKVYIVQHSPESGHSTKYT